MFSQAKRFCCVVVEVGYIHDYGPLRDVQQAVLDKCDKIEQNNDVPMTAPDYN